MVEEALVPAAVTGGIVAEEAGPGPLEEVESSGENRDPDPAAPHQTRYQPLQEKLTHTFLGTCAQVPSIRRYLGGSVLEGHYLW
jgi:hypothetical protein